MDILPEKVAARIDETIASDAIITRRLGFIMLFRVVLFTLMLGGTVAVNFALGTPEALGGPYVTFLFVVIAGSYVLNIGYAVVLRIVRRPRPMVHFQIAVDIITAAAIVHFTGGADSGFVLFFLLTPIAAAVTLKRGSALLVAGIGTVVMATVIVLGYLHLLPVMPGQTQLPWQAPAETLGRTLVLNGTAMLAVALLAGYLAEQLRFAAERVEVQQAHIDDLSAINADIIRCLTSGLLTVANDGTVLSMNQAAREILQLGDDEAQGASLAAVAPDLGDSLSVDGDVRRSEVTVRRGSASKLLGISVSPLTDHLNTIRGRIVNFQDLTQIRQMEERVKRAEHLASLGRMAAGIAHEIRNPLAAISGALELLRGTSALEAEDQRLMDIALREIGRLNQLVTDFLNYARPQPPRLERVNLTRELPLLVGSIDGLTAGQNVPRIAVTTCTAPAWVSADLDQLRGVLWNLIRNACEAGEQNVIEVELREADGNSVELLVKDTASGIADEQLAQIFEPFFTTKDTGTGLGLPTVYHIVQAHRGSIDVDSAQGRGAVFRITLPRTVGPE